MKDLIAETKDHPDRAATFERVVGKSLAVIEYIVDLPNREDQFESYDNWHKRLRLQADVAHSMVSNAVKIDDASLRHQAQGNLIELMREEMKKIPIPSKSD